MRSICIKRLPAIAAGHDIQRHDCRNDQKESDKIIVLKMLRRNITVNRNFLYCRNNEAECHRNNNGNQREQHHETKALRHGKQFLVNLCLVLTEGANGRIHVIRLAAFGAEAFRLTALHDDFALFPRNLVTSRHKQ